MTRFKFYTGFLFFIIVVIFIIQNPVVVNIKFFIWEIKNCPILFLVIIPLLIATSMSFLFGIIKSMRFNAKYKKEIEKRNEELEIYKKEIRKYRDLMSEDGTSAIGKLL